MISGDGNENVVRHFEIGVRYMPTFTNTSFRTSTGETVRAGVTLGHGAAFVLGVNLSRHVGIQAEVNYYSVLQKYNDRNVTNEVKLRYVNFPLLLSLNTNKAAAFNINLVAGPQLGVNTGATIRSSGSNGTDQPEAVVAINPRDIGLAYGFGIEIAVNSKRTIRMDLGYRGFNGLVTLADDDAVDGNSYNVVADESRKTNAAYLGLTLIF